MEIQAQRVLRSTPSNNKHRARERKLLLTSHALPALNNIVLVAHKIQEHIQQCSWRRRAHRPRFFHLVTRTSLTQSQCGIHRHLLHGTTSVPRHNEHIRSVTLDTAADPQIIPRYRIPKRFRFL